MKRVEPAVFLIARPLVDIGAVKDYLDLVGGTGWLDRIEGSTDAETLIEFAGRLCYRSWEPGLNPNVTKVRTDSRDYLENVLKSKHGSVLEHANFTFVFHNVSRVFTHELVRHRAGVAISQESLRYVRLTDLSIWLPDALANKPEFRTPLEHKIFQQKIVSIVETLEQMQVHMGEYFKIDESGIPFHYKKEVTSAMRRLAPDGLATTIVWTANVRTLRHVIEMRTATGAEQEIREVFNKVGEIMVKEAPNLFGDFVSLRGEWLPQWSKV